MTTSKVCDESGSRKPGLSCAECRRSKLKCDRVFPCQSCIRRGCPGICPEGTLAATKGNKVLMAQAQRLTEQVKMLNARVQELEAALGQTQPPPIRMKMHTNLVTHDRDSYGEGEGKEISKAMGSLSLGLDGQAKYHGESAGSEYLQDLLGPSEEDIQIFKQGSVNLPNEIIDLMRAFPFGLKDCPYNNSIFFPYLPTKQRAMELASIYYRNVAWMYDPVSFEDFMMSIINPIYGDHGYAVIDALHSHRLSVFFMVLAHGRFYHPLPATDISAEQFHSLARAALSLDSILIEVTPATVQALFLVFRFVYDADLTAKEERWLLAGLCARIAHTIGLQRDGAAWGLEREEIQRRRRLFWELFVWESWSSLVHGRPGALLINHTDCKFADDLDPFHDPSGKIELGFHAWKFRYSAECLSVSVDHVFSTKAPPYSALLAIEKKIHQFPIPNHLRSPEQASDTGLSWSSDPVRALQQYCTLCVRESNLLYIHRSYFAQAIRETSENPLQHKYGRSVSATYQSACRLISSLRSLYLICPLASHVWFFWSGVFSACVVLGAFVVESPGCSLSERAIHILETTLPFFEDGSRPCRPPSSLIFLQKMYKRASSSYGAFRSGLFQNSNQSNETDDLEVIGGRKSVITPKSNTNSPSYLHRESEGGSSPPSHSGAAETLMVLHQHIDSPPSHPQKSPDFGMAPASQFQHPPYSKVMETEHGYMDARTSAAPELPVGLTSGNQADLSPRKVASWQPSYSTDRHHYSPHSPSSNVYAPYDTSVDMQDTGSEGVRYGYIPAPMTQDEIWRNFMLTFNGQGQ